MASWTPATTTASWPTSSSEPGPGTGRCDLSRAAPAGPEATNLLHVARIAVRAATAREESRGAHFRTDFPAADTAWAHRLAIAGDQIHPLAPAPVPDPTTNLTEAA